MKDEQKDLPAEPKSQISFMIPSELWKEIKNRGWNWADVLKFGTEFKIADSETLEYPPCNLLNKTENLSKMLTKLSEEKFVLEQENYELKEKLKGEKAI